MIDKDIVYDVDDEFMLAKKKRKDLPKDQEIGRTTSEKINNLK